ncbi:MAG: SDR family oxidoreductase [Bacteroidetes bacterium]|nr:SDR family oxidoreductase [Bacteroidota bacterium]
MTVEGKVAIVTGAGQGIGLEVVRQLLQQGAAVVLNDLDAQLCASALQALPHAQGRCCAVVGDAADPAIIDQMISRAVAEFGQLDIAMANAGITLFGDFETYLPQDLHRVLEVNIGGTFLLAQQASNRMRQQGRGGSLLFTGSVVGHQAHRGLAAYAMTKAAVEMLAKNLVVELSTFGINVNCIAPGATLTERTQQDEGYATVWSRITPMGRPATVQDIAHAAVFLVSDQARHITGQSLIIDGGWTSVSTNPY